MLLTNELKFLHCPNHISCWAVLVTESVCAGCRLSLTVDVQYGRELADHTITLLLVFVFCVMQPFIPLIGLVYFVCNYFYARYDLLYSKREAFQSGGLFWPVVRVLHII